MVFDGTRLPATWNMRLSGLGATGEMETRKLHVTGTGKGHLNGDSLVLDIAWRYPEKNCEGTIHLTGAPANRGVALIGEFTYRDGCDGDRQKGGTFSLWSGKRVTTHLARR